MSNMDGFSEEDMKVLLPLFLASGRSYVSALREGLMLLRKSRLEAETLKSAHRAVHSLKGAALQIGFVHVGTLAASIEDAIEGFWDDPDDLTPDGLEALEQGARLMAAYLDDIEGTREVSGPPGDLLGRLAELTVSQDKASIEEERTGS